MTAAQIAAQFENPVIEIDSLCCEFLSGMMFESNPINDLEFVKLGELKFKQKY